MAKQPVEQFPVDGNLLMVLPRAGASVKNPDVSPPVLRSDNNGYFLEMQVKSDSLEEGELALTRRIPLDNLTSEEWEELQHQYQLADFQTCISQGINKGVTKIQDRKVRRLFMALMTFLNPRQVAIVLYLYKAASEQQNGSQVTFRSNNLLESLGYSRTKDGGFPAKLRSQLNCDLVALHRTELVFAQSLRKGEKVGAKVVIKNVLRIKDYEIDNVPRNFDLVTAADYTYELADAYTIGLEFFDGPNRKSDYVLFPCSLDLSQKLGSNAKNNYKSKLLVYLTSRIKWDKLEDGQYLLISKTYLYKNLDLLGSNSSRNNQIFWRTVEELKQDGYIFEAVELSGKKAHTTIQFKINPGKLSTSS